LPLFTWPAMPGMSWNMSWMSPAIRLVVAVPGAKMLHVPYNAPVSRM
jgi:hypothetical protein